MSETPQPDFYFVSQCGAKFFHTEETAECPRCGEQLTSREKLIPPWKCFQEAADRKTADAEILQSRGLMPESEPMLGMIVQDHLLVQVQLRGKGA